jgi:uncharacterized protein YxjI
LHDVATNLDPSISGVLTCGNSGCRWSDYLGRYTADLPGRGGLETQGDILHHEHMIEENRRPVATISKRWFRIRDTYGIEVLPGTIDPLLAVATTVAIDMMQGVG